MKKTIFIFIIIFFIVVSINIIEFQRKKKERMKEYRYSTEKNLSCIKSTKYDYIVIGGGASGCVAAYTLVNSEKEKKVLLIEAGEAWAPWDLYPEDKRGVFRTNGFTMSNVLGGGSSVNYRLYRSPNLNYINDMFNKNDDRKLFYSAAMWCRDFFSKPSFYNANVKKIDDYDFNWSKFLKNKENTITFMNHFRDDTNMTTAIDPCKPSVYFGESSTVESNENLDTDRIGFLRTSGAYLIKNNTNRNLNLLSNTYVTKINFHHENNSNNDKIATSIDIIHKGKKHNLFINNAKLIITSGVYQTPYLLQMSGYGPSSLKSIKNYNKIFTNKESEECGKNYFNNMYLNRIFGSLFNFSLGVNPVRKLTDKSVERIYFSLCRTIKNKNNSNPRKVVLQCFQTLKDGIPSDYFDVECSSEYNSQKFQRGQVLIKSIDINKKNHKENMKPSVTYGYTESKESLDEISKCVLDSIQVYFEDIYLNFYKDVSNSKDDIYTSLLKQFTNGALFVDSTVGRWSETQYRIIDQIKKIISESTNQDLDSIHYGGTTSKCTNKDDGFKLIGTTNVYIGDLSVYEKNLQGNTMAAAFCIGRFVAKKLLDQKGQTIRKLNQRQQILKNQLLWFNKNYIDYISEGYKPLLNTDISNIWSDFYINNIPIEAHTFSFDVEEYALAGTTKNYEKNIFLITKKEYHYFDIIFEVKLERNDDWEKQLNSGFQFWSYSDNKFSLTGPQIEIDEIEYGGVFYEGSDKGWLVNAPKLTQSIWKKDEYNRYNVSVRPDYITLKINDTEMFKEATTPFNKFYNPSNKTIKNRLGFQIHAPFGPYQYDRKIFFKNIIIKEYI